MRRKLRGPYKGNRSRSEDNNLISMNLIYFMFDKSLAQ